MYLFQILGLQPTELIVILLVVFVVFGGATQIPKLAKALGQSKKAFREGMREAEESFDEERKKEIEGGSSKQLSQMSDEEMMAEMRRRAEAKQ